uniref:Uncharacterized protein n=1 Tax=Micrurus carvalhoi TaxID=3147026 RepID=A0A2H6N5W0_9SAUR
MSHRTEVGRQGENGDETRKRREENKIKTKCNGKGGKKRGGGEERVENKREKEKVMSAQALLPFRSGGIYTACQELNFLYILTTLHLWFVFRGWRNVDGDHVVAWRHVVLASV